MFRTKWVLAAFGLCLVLPMAGAAQSPASGPTAALRWRSVGPYTGGRITTVAGIASRPNEFFMGTAGGGVWETTNYGHSWKNVSDKYFKTGNIGAMAIAPSNPRIIYVGTGDYAPRNTEVTGEGMYKSTDGGKTWSFIGLGATHIISWIVVDPTTRMSSTPPPSAICGDRTRSVGSTRPPTAARPGRRCCSSTTAPAR